ncbi:MAG TPA: hypothetical protein PKZ21_04830 [Bacteroidales bacterium]|nr:hypothetical protein [Bacteroidales bacterium]
MEKNNIKHDIIDLLEIIVEQAEIINHYKHEIPQIELDILMENIRELYDNYKKLDKINKPVPQSSEPLNNPVNIPPSIQETTAKETYIPEIKLAEIPEIIEEEEKIVTKEKLNEVEIEQAEKKIKPKKTNIDLFSSATVSDKFKDHPTSLNDKLSGTKANKSIFEKHQKNAIKDLKTAIGINEKFKFINELFEGNLQKYNDTITTLNNLTNSNEAQQYLANFQVEFSWNNKHESYIEFVELITRRYQE